VSDLLAELGPPIRTFYKEDTRMAIHSDGAGDYEEEDGSCECWFQAGQSEGFERRDHEVASD